MAISVASPSIPQPHEEAPYRYLTEKQRLARLHALVMKEGVKALEAHTGVAEANHVLDLRTYDRLTEGQAVTSVADAIESWFGKLKVAANLTQDGFVFDLAVPNDGTNPDAGATLLVGDGITNSTVAVADSDAVADIKTAIAAVLETSADAMAVTFETTSVMRVVLATDAKLADGETAANTVSLL